MDTLEKGLKDHLHDLDREVASKEQMARNLPLGLQKVAAEREAVATILAIHGLLHEEES